MKTLYISDLDGTLLRNDASLSPETVRVINGKIAEGMLFSYATARSFATASVVTAGLDLRLPVILNNGSFVSDSKTGTYIESCFLDSELTKPVISAMTRERVPVLVFAVINGRERVSWLLGNENPGINAYNNTRKGDVRLRGVSDMEALFEGDIFQFTIIGSEKEAMRFHKICNRSEHCLCGITQDTYDPAEWWLEIYRHDATKASAVEKLKRLTGADRVVSFGDNLNDLPMFDISDESYAVANAKDKLKKAASAVIGSNMEDGVAKWLEANVK